MGSQTGIINFGAYLPRRRLQRRSIYDTNKWFAPGLRGLSKGEKAISNWDEDAITMAVEAARDCLIGYERSELNRLSLASTTLPFLDRSNAGVIKEALNLNESVRVADVTGSQRAGTAALMQALEAGQTHLCLSAERRNAKMASTAELTYGDGSAALLVGKNGGFFGDIIAKYLGGYSLTQDFVDHFRASDAEFDYAWEGRFVRDEGYLKILGQALQKGLDSANLTGLDIDHAVISVPVRGVPEKLAKGVGISSDALADVLMATVGDTGAAHPSLMLASILEKAKPGENILFASFGQGADVMLFQTTDAIETRSKGGSFSKALSNRTSDDNYQRYLFHRDLIVVEKGMRAEMDEKQPGSSLARERKAVLGLIGGRCIKTGTVQFPKTDVSVNPNSRETFTQEDYPLSNKQASVLSYTADALAYCPDPPGYYGMIDFDGGGRMVAEFADVTEEDVAVGRNMRMVFRIKAIDDQRSFKKYFWKATPIRDLEQTGGE